MWIALGRDNNKGGLLFLPSYKDLHPLEKQDERIFMHMK